MLLMEAKWKVIKDGSRKKLTWTTQSDKPFTTGAKSKGNFYLYAQLSMACFSSVTHVNAIWSLFKSIAFDVCIRGTFPKMSPDTFRIWHTLWKSSLEHEAYVIVYKYCINWKQHCLYNHEPMWQKEKAYQRKNIKKDTHQSCQKVLQNMV